MIALRPYQERAIAAARGLCREHKRILLTLPTGGGKTVIAAQVIAGAIAKGKRALFVAHRREIVAQSWAKLLDAGVPASEVGVIMADGRITNPADGMVLDARRPNARAQVASVQTLARRARPAADVVFVDEAHHATAQTWQDLIRYYTDRGAVVLGLTATPCRSDGRGLSDIFEHLHPVAAVSELVAAGYLVAPEVYSVPAPDLSKIKTTGGDYDLDQLGDAMDRSELVGRLVDHWQELACNRTTVVFATTVAHSQSIVGKFTAAGIRAEHIDGETPTEQRDAILGRLASGETQVVSNCQVLTEGWDLPRCKTVVLARPTQSLSLYLQMAGRGLRPWEGVPALLLDHAGCARRHGLPQQDRTWTLEGREKGSKRPASEADPSVKFCPQCSRTVLRGTTQCPGCGFSFTAEEVVETDDKLVKITAAQADEAARAELRRLIARAVFAHVNTWTASGWTPGEAATELNRGLVRRFRRSRTTMDTAALERVLAYVTGAAFAADFPAPVARPRVGQTIEAATARALIPLADLSVERQRLGVVRALPPAPQPEEEVVSWAL